MPMLTEEGSQSAISPAMLLELVDEEYAEFI